MDWKLEFIIADGIHAESALKHHVGGFTCSLSHCSMGYGVFPAALAHPQSLFDPFFLSTLFILTVSPIHQKVN